MLIRTWNRFATNDGRFGPGHPEYRRAYLINSILVAMAIMFLFFLALNAAVLRQGPIAALNLFGAAAAVSALVWFHRRDRILSSAVATVTIEILVIAGLLLIRGHRQYAFYWIMVIPLSSFFLLGRKLGRLFTSAVFVCFAALLVFRFGYWKEAGFGLESLFNVALALISLTLMVGYYEQSRNEAIVALEQKNLELKKLTVTDKLTGIYNRIKLDDVLSYELSNADRYGRTFSIIMGDVDLFKSVNDRFGHVAGDSVLVEMAKLMRNACRRIDTVGRWGGEEFLVICPETRLDGAYGLAERMRRIIEANDFPVARRVTISFGVSEYSPGDDIPSLLRRADAALYAAKSRGRNCVGK